MVCESISPWPSCDTLEGGIEEESEVVRGIKPEAGGLLSKNLEKFLLTNGLQVC